MSQSIKIKRPEWIRSKRRQVTVRSASTVHVPMDAGLWSGGSRDLYFSVPVPEGDPIVPIHNAMLGPFDPKRVSSDHTPSPGFGILIQHDNAGRTDHTLVVHPSDFTIYQTQQ